MSKYAEIDAATVYQVCNSSYHKRSTRLFSCFPVLSTGTITTSYLRSAAQACNMVNSMREAGAFFVDNVLFIRSNSKNEKQPNEIAIAIAGTYPRIIQKCTTKAHYHEEQRAYIEGCMFRWVSNWHISDSAFVQKEWGPYLDSKLTIHMEKSLPKLTTTIFLIWKKFFRWASLYQQIAVPNYRAWYQRVHQMRLSLYNLSSNLQAAAHRSKWFNHDIWSIPSRIDAAAFKTMENWARTGFLHT